MGLWAGIKHALNSTLGTSDFMPLDKMIISQTRMNISDNLYCSLPSFNIAANYGSGEMKEYPERYKMTRYGSMRIKGELYRSSSPVAYTFYLYKNNSQIYVHASGTNTSLLSSFEKDISFVPGDEIYIKIIAVSNSSNYSGSVELRNLAMYGDVVPNVFLTV